MELNGNTLIVAGLLLAAVLAEMRLLRRDLKIHMGALAERSRRRDMRQRRESSAPKLQRHRDLEAVPELHDDEETDIHVLVELEREHQRARRKTDRQQRQPGSRPPRPGTHHDR